MEGPEWSSIIRFNGDEMDDGNEEMYNPDSMSMQIPTPPASVHGESPIREDPTDGNILVSVSTTFYPGAQHQSRTPDVALLSSDSVFFYVHSHLLLDASSNRFNSLIPPSSCREEQSLVLQVLESSVVLNIILHAVYNMSCAHYTPNFHTLVAAVDKMSSYGISPKTKIAPSMPLYSLLLSQAPLFPIDLYALASHHDLYDLAVATSSHLLSFPLFTITDELAQRIGPIYLKRLFFLHIGRSDALKRVLLSPPHPHPQTETCDFSNQKSLTRAWALASAYLAWEVRPDLSTSAMESALTPLLDHLTCNLCKDALSQRIKDLVVQWAIVKRTI